jgi:hypothetical protein
MASDLTCVLATFLAAALADLQANSRACGGLAGLGTAQRPHATRAHARDGLRRFVPADWHDPMARAIVNHRSGAVRLRPPDGVEATPSRGGSFAALAFSADRPSTSRNLTRRRAATRSTHGRCRTTPARGDRATVVGGDLHTVPRPVRLPDLIAKYPRHAVRFTGVCTEPLIRPSLVIDDETLELLRS